MSDRCRCGRELRLLNEASDNPKCVGCGHLPDQCTCVASEPTATEHPNG